MVVINGSLNGFHGKRRAIKIIKIISEDKPEEWLINPRHKKRPVVSGLIH